MRPVRDNSDLNKLNIILLYNVQNTNYEHVFSSQLRTCVDYTHHSHNVNTYFDCVLFFWFQARYAVTAMSRSACRPATCASPSWGCASPTSRSRTGSSQSFPAAQTRYKKSHRCARALERGTDSFTQNCRQTTLLVLMTSLMTSRVKGTMLQWLNQALGRAEAASTWLRRCRKPAFAAVRWICATTATATRSRLP